MDLQLTDRTFVVTGGTAGLGFAVATTLVAEGANVLVASRDGERVERAVADLGGRASGLVVDVRDGDAPTRLVAAARERFDGFDGAFVSYGGPPAGPATELDDDALRASVEAALVAPVRLARDFAAACPAGGAVVVLTSSSQAQPIPGLAGSNLTRPGIWGYVKTLADEVGPRGVRVNCLVPGRLSTGRVAELEQDIADRTGRSAEDVRTQAEQAVPLRRLGEPEELGRVATFLLSPAASYVTGAAWAVDGGALRGL